MQWIKPGTNYNFIAVAPNAIIGSAALILFFLLYGLFIGPKWGIDFTGGTEIHLKVSEGKGIDDIRKALSEVGMANDSVQQFGPQEDRTYLVRVQDVHFGSEDTYQILRKALEEEYGAEAFTSIRFDPQVGTEMEVVPKEKLTPAAVNAVLVKRGLLPGSSTVKGGEVVPQAGPPASAPVEGGAPEGALKGDPAESSPPPSPPPAGAGLAGAGPSEVMAGTGDPAPPASGAVTPLPVTGVAPGSEAPAPPEEAVPGSTAEGAAPAPPVGVPPPVAVAPSGGSSSSADAWVSSSNVDADGLVIRFPGISQKIKESLQKSSSMGPGTFEVLKVDTVGPKAGKELREKAILSVLITSLLILVYVAFRFDMSFAPGAVIALIHDVAIAVGVMIILQREINMDIVGAALTILGYSVNDTIVVYDRIRENVRRHRRKDIRWVINRSINETLSRSILTSLTVLFVVLVLVLLGGPVLRNLALCLLFGVISGTYSTIFIASPVIIYLSRWFPMDTRAIVRE